MSNKPVDLVLSKLKNVKKIKGGWTAKCPCHDDHENSLCISEGADGRALLYCHAGCHFKNIVTTLGFEVSEMFTEDTQRKNKHYATKTWNKQMIVKTYDYTDEKSNLLFQICRTVRKEFPIRRPDGKGGWSWGLGDTSLVLYHLPSVIEAVTRGETLFIVEGEKDADRLQENGLFATTSPLGAGKWRPEYNTPLKGSHVVIFPDNDPPGRQHAQQVAEQLQGVSDSVKIVQLPNLQEKEDVSDWLDKYGTIDQLLELVANTQTPQKEPIKEYTFQDLESLIGPIQWAWKGWLPLGLLTIVASEPGIGKSALALRLAASVILGLPWPDGKTYDGSTGSILWCESEAAQAINLERAKQWGIPLTKIKLPMLDNPLVDVQLDNTTHRNAVQNAAQREDVRFIVVDSLRGCHRLDENGSESIEIVMWLAKLARDTCKPVLLTHHLRKKSNFDGDSVNLDRLRGSSAIIQPARMIWAMDTPDPELPDHKRLSVIKSNISKFPEPIGFIINGNGPEFGEAPDPPQKDNLLTQVKGRLIAMLNKQPLPATDVFEAIEADGISKITIKRAKQALKIVVFRKDEQWFWSLPFSKNSVR
ncbi:MAG: AAA family ATPase [Syntrophales bacterium LBB04]|nr:AAA family ATPase [Syntrophales bacterium LBB04]